MKNHALPAVVGLIMGFGFFAVGADAKPPTVVNCDAARGLTSIQEAVDVASGPETIFIEGTCTEDVTITKDDITLSGNQAAIGCNKADPSASAGAMIDGTITVDGVRATIEHLVITGSGSGVEIINRANVHLTCNDISNNEKWGVDVLRSSNAVLKTNTLSGNGTRETDPFIFFDVGLFAGDASSVQSLGNTYKDNQYAAIDIDRQSLFRNGAFLPREPGGGPADPDERDVITQRGCNPDGTGCFSGAVAIEIFNGGSVDLRNADVNGEMEVVGLSSFRVDADADIQGNILNNANSVVRLKDRSFLGDREVTFDGTLTCDASSVSYFSNVQCGQTCTGSIPGTCSP